MSDVELLYEYFICDSFVVT